MAAKKQTKPRKRREFKNVGSGVAHEPAAPSIRHRQPRPTGAAAAFGMSKIFGLAAVVLASINIFGGFIVSQRMLAMFRKKK